ncbi:MAG: hypothetical protein ACYTGQ_05080 [Planctomycetota bacterium]|jgi:hypothetical protein
MPPTPLILILDEPAWRLGAWSDNAVSIETVEHAQDASPAVRAAALRATLDARPDLPQRVLLALPARRCLVAPIDTTGLPRAKRLQAMRYAMEEQIPAPVEQLAIDFISHDHRALGLATDAAELAAVVDALQGQSIEATAATPLDLLTARSSASADLTIRQTHDGHISLFVVAPGSSLPADWWWFDDNTDALRQNLGRYAAEHGTDADATVRVDASGLSEANLAALRAIDEVELVATDTLTSDRLAVQAVGQSKRRHVAAIDFLPALQEAASTTTAGIPHRILTAALLLAIAFPASLLYRASQYNSITAKQCTVQASLFEGYFGRPAPPAGIARHFNSELNKARMGLVTEHAAAPYPAATDLMRHTLTLIPSEAQLAIRRLEFEPDRLRIEGHAARNEDAYALEAALNDLHRLAPRVEQIEDSGARDRKRVFTLIATEPVTGPGVAAGGAP